MRFRTKPCEIDAVQFLPTETDADLLAHLEGCVGWYQDDGGLRIPTLEGVMLASPGDWIVKGTEGEFYPVKPTPFAKKYEPVPSPAPTREEPRE